MKISFVLITLVLNLAVSAQNHYFIDETNLRLPPTNKLCVVADGADIDSDGDIDILASVDRFVPPFIPCYLFVNDGNGYFTQENMSRLPDTSVAFYDVGFGDIDNDMDYDIYLVSEHYQDLLFINDNYGYFSNETFRLPALDSENSYFVFGDFSGDMFIDIIIICVFDNGLNHYLLNNRAGYFDDVTLARMPEDTLFHGYGAVIDVDNDFDLDLLLTYMEDFSILHIQGLENVDGSFIHFNSERMPDRSARWLDTADIDNDGDLDIIISGIIDRSIFINYYGTFEDETGSRLPLLGPEHGISTMVGLGDYDNDGDTDIYAGFSTNKTDHLFINDGYGYFSLADERVPETEASTVWVEPFDADNDGDLDIFLGCASDGQQRVFINYSTPDSVPPSILAFDCPQGGLDSSGEYWFKVSAHDNITVEKGMLGVFLVYSLDGAMLDTLNFIHGGGTIFKRTLSELPVGSSVDYYVFIRDKMGNLTCSPPGAPDSLYNFTILLQTEVNNNEYILPGELIKIYPNPFNSSTTITLNNMKGGETQISIYDISGKLVITLTAKEGITSWDAVDNSGQRVSSGIYFARAKTSRNYATIKLIFLK